MHCCDSHGLAAVQIKIPRPWVLAVRIIRCRTLPALPLVSVPDEKGVEWSKHLWLAPVVTLLNFWDHVFNYLHA